MREHLLPVVWSLAIVFIVWAGYVTNDAGQALTNAAVAMVITAIFIAIRREI